MAREKQEFPEYMNAKTTASYLSISFGTLQLLERMGLKSIKVNSKKLFRKTSVDEFMAGLEQEK